MSGKYHIADFAEIPGVACPCGAARRAFADAEDFPATVHRTSIAEDARTHYHKRLTETYYFLECAPGAMMQLNGDLVEVKPGLCIVVPPGVRHRAIGKMEVLIIAMPKFDPADEWFD
jgi:mannose-6-phosphate isomerase-like protein (cupin superfamily)